MSLCIIIPAFNEEMKLEVDSYRNFLKENEAVRLVIVNDGSTDNTLSILEKLKASFENKLSILTNEHNSGKAQSVLNGMQYALSNVPADRYAFLDADLATSFEECITISYQLKNEINFCFGSRILTVDNKIERKIYRHYIGRIIATAISKVLKLEVYDTQCGCKVFSADLAQQIFQGKFISKWLFDVELFFRILKYYGRETAIKKMHEYPLKEWVDKGESKVKFSYFFKLWIDLWRIRRQYKGV